VKAGSEVAVESTDAANEPAWRKRAVSRSLNAARSRAEQRVQRYLDAAFELIDEKETIEFTIQEVIDRSGQSLRGFYQYFDGKDELLLALFEETALESSEDLRKAFDRESDPLERLRAFTIRLHEWCDPSQPGKRGAHNRRPISEFSVQLVITHPDQVTAALAPVAVMLRELVEDAAAAGEIKVDDARRAASLIQQMVMYSWFTNRMAPTARQRITAEDLWEFILHGLRADG
jgi:AcrR family transcriptional regulator